MRILWLSLFILICELASLVQALNAYSHAFERIWLWEMYDLFCDIEGGAHLQKMIMKQNPRHKWTLEKNMGSGPNGKLTFSEFQLRLEGGKAILIDMTPPKDADDVHRAAKQLLDLGWAKELKPHAVVAGLEGKKVDLKIDPWGDSYTSMVELIEKQYSRYHYDIDGFEATYGNRMQRIRAITDMVVALRFEDSSKHFSNRWRKPKEFNGFAMKLEQGTHYVKTDSTYKGSGAQRWDKIDIGKVWEDNSSNEALQAAGYTKREDLFNLVNSYEDDDSKDLGNEDNKKHARVMRMWKQVAHKIRMMKLDLESCPG